MRPWPAGFSSWQPFRSLKLWKSVNDTFSTTDAPVTRGVEHLATFFAHVSFENRSLVYFLWRKCTCGPRGWAFCSRFAHLLFENRSMVPFQTSKSKCTCDPRGYNCKIKQRVCTKIDFEERSCTCDLVNRYLRQNCARPVYPLRRACTHTCPPPRTHTDTR